MGFQMQRFFAAAAKHKGIATLESGHPFALASQCNQEFIDLVLGQGMFPRFFTHRVEFRI